MPEELVYYISKYGYVAIFIILLLQEVGMPNPIPVELLVFFTGYLSFKGLLYLPLVIITAASADFIGATILFSLFYTMGNFLLQKKPRWIPISEKKIAMFKQKINNGGLWNIYMFRLVSITRGYASIITGLLHIKPKKYLPIVLLSAITWTSLYAILGFVLGPFWNMIIGDIDRFKYVLFGILFIVISISVFRWLRNRNSKKTDITPLNE